MVELKPLDLSRAPLRDSLLALVKVLRWDAMMDELLDELSDELLDELSDELSD